MAAVDILMATHNGERYVREQVESIQAQTFSDWRLLVSDDCSTDGTLEVMRVMAGTDPRIEVVFEGIRHGSAKSNFMSLLTHVEAPYAMFCDQDDVWLPEKVERTFGKMQELEAAHKPEEPLLVFSDMEVVNERLETTAESFMVSSRFDHLRTALPQLAAQNVAAGCTMMMNASLVGLCERGVDPDRIAMHDWWAIMVAAAFGRIGYVDDRLSLYRQHGHNEVGANSYSPVERAKDTAFMKEQFAVSVEQAAYFKEVFDGGLSARDAAALEHFCSIPDADSAWGGGSSADHERLLEERGPQAGPDCDGCGFIAGIWGGIVTYNPDIARLKENVSAISTQVERALVFDNGSDNVEDVAEALEGFGNVEVARNGSNAGMAVALNALASEAARRGASDIVFLDQDSAAAKDMVYELARHRAADVGVVCPLVVDRNVDRVEEDCEAVYEVKRPITSGSLVSLRAWSSVGGYDERLFVDWVDNEFADNLRFHGYKLVRTHAAALLHEMGRQEYAWSGPGRDYANNRRVRRGYYRQNYPEWRWRDRARSQSITIAKYGFSRIGFEEMLLFLKATVGRILLIEENKLVNLKAISKGVCDARRCGYVVEPRNLHRVRRDHCGGEDN